MSKKLIVILGIVAFFMVVGLGAGFFVMWSKITQLSAAPQENVEAEDVEEVDATAQLGPTMALNPFVVNLADSGGNRFLRMSVELELSEEPLRQEITTRLPQVRNAMLMILPNKRFEDINSSDGKEALREEIITAVNDLLTKGEVKNIYYTEFVIQ